MKNLLHAAMRARKNTYAPYSKFKVGAAIETIDGRIFTGCNIENASYGLAICAERVAVFKAVSEGVKKFKRIAIVTGAKKPTPPCGMCRQVLFEFNPNLEIIIANTNGKVIKTKLSKLFPYAFGPKNLK